VMRKKVGLLRCSVHCRATAIQNIDLHGWVRLLHFQTPQSVTKGSIA
jgi:hypothetical protein